MLDRSNVITACLRFHKASKDHRAAQLLLEHGYYEAANDRAFFCMLHAARALMAYISLNDAMNDYTPTDVVIQNFQSIISYSDTTTRAFMKCLKPSVKTERTKFTAVTSWQPKRVRSRTYRTPVIFLKQQKPFQTGVWHLTPTPKLLFPSGNKTHIKGFGRAKPDPNQLIAGIVRLSPDEKTA